MSLDFVELYLNSSVGLESVSTVEEYKNICYSFHNKIFVRHDNLKKLPKEISQHELKFEITPHEITLTELEKLNSHRIELINHYTAQEVVSTKVKENDISENVSSEDELYDLKLLKAIVESKEISPSKKVIRINKKYFGYDSSKQVFEEIEATTNFNQFKTCYVEKLLRQYSLNEIARDL